MISFTIDGVDKLVNKLSAQGALAKKECTNAIEDAALKMSEEAMKNLSDNKSVKTGSLIKSLGTQAVKVDTQAMTATIETNIEYAAYVEYGSAAHIIEVKNGKVLTDGKSFFGKKVHHPGNKPKPFFRPAFEIARKQLIDRLNTFAG